MSDLNNKNEITRRAAREQAFTLVFEKSFHPECSFDEIIDNASDAEESVIDDFARSEAVGVFDNLDEIDNAIASNLCGWKIKRISKTALAVLRLAVYEIKFNDSIPDGVSINEAVEIAKKYCGDDDPSFVNGVLGSIVRGKDGK